MSAYLINWDDLSADSRKWYKQQTADVQKVVDDCIRLIAMSPYGERPTYKHLKAEFYCNWRYREGDFRIRLCPKLSG